jgi:cytosine/adenosine deaminase-related metal-dependent hydrolase
MSDVDQNRVQSVKARWLFSVASSPIENGVLEFHEGRITAIHDRPDGQAVDLGNVALIPSLVNAHTHLEFSDLRQPVQPALPFTAWIQSLVATRRNQHASIASIQLGLEECLNSGALSVGEIATQDWPPTAYHHSTMRSVVFREILGLRRERVFEQFEVARKWLEQASNSDGSMIRGLSPHAPYSVHPDLYRKLIDLAAEHEAPVAVHLAETQAELEFLSQGSGEFVTMLQKFGAWDETAIPRGTRPLDYLLPLENVPRALVVHGNYLSDDELNWLSHTPTVSVVYCPRTHAFFGHTAHPWIRMLDLEISVAIGTDSRGSNPDLSLWEELRFLRSHFPNIDPEIILTLGTLSGARALGLDSDIGSLEVGKRAEFAIVNLEHDSSSDPHELLFSSGAIGIL